MRIDVLRKDEYNKLNDFLNKIPYSLIYYSTQFKTFLDNFVGEKSTYFVIKEEDNIIALLPTVLKENLHYGNVLNSSPFYGSNGGVISLEPSLEINKLLTTQFFEFAEEKKCISSTIITSPFEPLLKWYEENTDYSYKDRRIGQVTNLPNNKSNLMDIFHSKTRNTVRKSLNGLEKIDYKNGLQYIDFIFETHKENMEAINGLYKPYSFFEQVIEAFPYKDNLKIYIGFDENNQPISGLLNLYFNKTVEYFCPVTVASFRNLQPLSGIIFQAMNDAIEEGYERWNWGGTWLNQGGVYAFKSRWGTLDYNYYYYTKVFNSDILEYSKSLILNEYPYFFVVPFSELKN